MLSHLHICGFAIIDQIDVELGGGMTVLTGETGAGKSILLDALGLVLGDRADSTFVRDGCDKADISAVFSIEDNPSARQWLIDNEYPSEDCVIRRTVSCNAPSRGYINGRMAPMQSLRTLGEMLVDIHGQHEHQRLMHRSVQRELLDDYADNRPLLTRIAHVHQKLNDTRQSLAELDGGEDADNLIELLSYQLNELDLLDLEPIHIQSLNDEYNRLSNIERLLSGCQQVLGDLYEDDAAVHSQIVKMHGVISALAPLDDSLSPLADTLNAAAIQCSEVASDLRAYLANAQTDEGQLASTEQTLSALYDLARKHHTQAEQLIDVRQHIAERLNQLQNAEQQRQQLSDRVRQFQEQYHDIDAQIGEARRKAAKSLGEEVTQYMQTLGMAAGRFVVEVDDKETRKYAAHGSHTVTFAVSTNPGQAPKPLPKVASGGELSRISLALQLVASRYKASATLIFDEVDSGIGGGVAETVGRQLRQLSHNAQVMCVTHLPQVAAQSTSHFMISKTNDGKATHTALYKLNPAQKIEEIARMLGGVDITTQSLAHAREMISKHK